MALIHYNNEDFKELIRKDYFKTKNIIIYWEVVF